MSIMKKNNWAIAAPVATLFLAAASLLSSGPALAAGSASPWGANYFPNVVLTTQNGKAVRFWDDLLKDKKVIVNFMYTDCGDRCPLETAKLAQVQRILGDRVGKDIFFYSISLDPAHDTPAALKAYAEKFNAGPGWLFLTGKKADIELVRKKLGQAALPDQNELKDHSSTMMLGNTATGQWLQAGMTDDPRHIAVIASDWLSSWKDHKKGGSHLQGVDVTTADRGAYLFETRCAACHTIGHGDGLGPDLAGVVESRNRAWITRYVAAPDQVLKSGDPIAKSLLAQYKKIRMPNLRLGDADVEALIRYMESKGAPGHAELRPHVPADAVAFVGDNTVGGR